MVACLSFLQRYVVEGDNCLRRVFDGDDTWIDHFTVTSKGSTMEWKDTGLPRKKKFTVTPSAGEVLVTVFWDSSGRHVDGQSMTTATAPR
jgi:hypothetical protein